MCVFMPVILLTKPPAVLGSVHLVVSGSNHKSMSVFGKACLNVSRSTDKGNWSFCKYILSLPLGLSTEIFQDVEVWRRLSLCLIAKIPAVLWNVSSDVSRCSLVTPIYEICDQMTVHLLTNTPAELSGSWRGGICSGNVLIFNLRPLHIPDVLVRRGLKSPLLHFGSSSEHFCLQLWPSPRHVFRGVSLFLRKTKSYLYDIWFSESGKYQGFGLLGVTLCSVVHWYQCFGVNCCLHMTTNVRQHNPENSSHFIIQRLFFLGKWSTCLCKLIVVYVFLDAATLTEVFPCFFLGCKANARVILAKTGHRPHSSKIVVLLYVLFVLYCSM